LRLFSFGGYGLALAALALVVFGAIECPPWLRLGYEVASKRVRLTEEGATLSQNSSYSKKAFVAILFAPHCRHLPK